MKEDWLKDFMLKSTDLPQGHMWLSLSVSVFFVCSRERLFLFGCCFIYFWARGLNSRASNMLTGSFGALVRWLVSNIIYHQFPFFKFHCASAHTHIQIHTHMHVHRATVQKAELRLHFMAVVCVRTNELCRVLPQLVNDDGAVQLRNPSLALISITQ